MQVQIGSWKAGGVATNKKSSSASISSGPHPPPLPPTPVIQHGIKIKSELCPVTETCTAATMPPATPPSQHKHRVKAEKTVNLGHASSPLAAASGRSPHHHSATPTTAPTFSSGTKTMPITPTLARIKNNHHLQDHHAHQLTAASLISPDLHRVKVEIGPAPSAPWTLPTSPIQDVRDGSFTSPRKRFGNR